MDFADDAQFRTEAHIDAALKRRQTLTVPFSGFCLSCKEPVGKRRFCDSNCREDYEARLKTKMGF